MLLTSPFHGIMDVNCLTSLNFTNCLKKLKILLKFEHITYVIEVDGHAAAEISELVINKGILRYLLKFNQIG